MHWKQRAVSYCANFSGLTICPVCQRSGGKAAACVQEESLSSESADWTVVAGWSLRDEHPGSTLKARRQKDEKSRRKGMDEMIAGMMWRKRHAENGDSRAVRCNIRILWWILQAPLSFLFICILACCRQPVCRFVQSVAHERCFLCARTSCLLCTIHRLGIQKVSATFAASCLFKLVAH